MRKYLFCGISFRRNFPFTLLYIVTLVMLLALELSRIAIIFSGKSHLLAFINEEFLTFFLILQH